MIDITHERARRLVREMLDRPIADRSWSALQAHLENCADCRAYQVRRARLERSLRRALHAAGLGLYGPPPGVAAALHQRMKTRARRVEFTRRALGAGGLVTLVALVLFFYWAFFRDAPSSTPPGAAIAGPTALPEDAAPTDDPRLRAGSEYRGVVAFEALIWGVPDIMLLTTGPNSLQIENLTTNPASDTAPAWSPDGEWLAFLSDRDRADGGADIYVINVAGTRLTRLTADPRLRWSAPLAWSPDGYWIAARAVNQNEVASESSWIYRVGLNGATPRPLPYTRGAHSPRFAPRQSLLAYVAVEGQLSFLRVYDAQQGLTLDLTRAEAAASGAGAGARDGPGSASVRAFDWAADGSGILYILNRSEPERDPYWVQVRWAQIPTPLPVTGETLLGAQSPPQELLTFPATSPVITAGLSGEGELLYTRTYRRDGRWTSCRPLQAPSEPVFSSLPGRSGGPDLPVLCIDSAIEREAWSSDGRTLVAAGRSTTEDDPGIYAMRLPAVGERRRVVRTERLADLPEGAGPLRVRPVPGVGGASTTVMAPISPAETADPAPLLPPPDLLADVLVTRENASGDTIARLTTDGSNLQALKGGRYGYCPTGTPYGGAQGEAEGRVAFLAWETGEGEQWLDIYRMDTDGKNVQRLTQGLALYHPDDPALDPRPAVDPPPAPVLYGCPVWSPDGSRLAAWAEARGEANLVILPADGDGAAVVTPLTPSGFNTPPVWTEDGQALVVFLQSPERKGAEVARVEAASGAVTHLLPGDGWSLGSSATGGTHGDWVAYTALRLTSGWYQVQADLRITNAADGRGKKWIGLPSYTMFSGVEGYGTLAWLPGAGDWDAPRLGMVFRGTPDGQQPSRLMMVDPAAGKVSTLAVLDEDVLSAAWSPDGRWVIYSTASGLWSLYIGDTQKAGGGLPARSAPVWLAETRAVQMDW